MTVLHFLETISPLAHKKGWIRWESGLARTLKCPACHTTQTMQTRRSVASPYSAHRRFRLYDCTFCGTAHFPDIAAPIYEDQSHGVDEQEYTAPKKFYVEQGAGFEAMIAPFFWARNPAIKTLLEVGCGYGFSLDFAGRALGWKAEGIDPSHIARHGAKELGLPIMDGYLGADTKLENMPFDLVFSSEVIEHIADPDPFVDVLARAAGADGTLLLTTPDIDGLRAERAVEEIIPLLSPGSHLVLYSADGLRACLKRAGFTNIEVTSTGDTLYAFASNNTLNVDFSAPIDRQILSRYMQGRLRAKDMPAHLRTGFAGRLLRLQTDAGDYPAAQKTLAILCKHWKTQYALDLDAPDTIEPDAQAQQGFVPYAASHPFNLVTVLYCAGILALNESRDQDLALAYFNACKRSYALMEPMLTAINASDLDSRKLAHEAALLSAGVLTQSDPARAVAAFENLDPALIQPYAERYEKTRMEVFAAAANSGDYTSAERLRPAVETALKSGPCQDDFEHAAAMGLAMMALNYRFDRPDGLYWLQKALDNAPAGPQWENMRKVWQTQSAAYGTELLVHGGQPAFTRKRDIIRDALQDATLSPKDFAIAEALGLAYMEDQPHTALAWLERALPLADEDHQGVTQARIADAQTRIFLKAVNAGDAQNADKTCAAATGHANASHDPGLHFALGLDALNRRCDLDEAAKRFALVADQQGDPSLRVQGAFHLAMVQARKGNISKAQKTAETLYSKANPHAALVAQLVGKRQAELDAAIAAAA